MGNESDRVCVTIECFRSEEEDGPKYETGITFYIEDIDDPYLRIEALSEAFNAFIRSEIKSLKKNNKREEKC